MDVLETGLMELIGVDERVDQNEFCASLALLDWVGGTPALRDRNGVIRSVVFFLNGAGAGISPAGELLFLDADPESVAGDADLSAAEFQSIFGNVALVAADVISDAAPTGGIASYHDLYISFHAMSAMYAVFKLTSATSFNDAGGDNEQLQVNVFYELRN